MKFPATLSQASTPSPGSRNRRTRGRPAVRPSRKMMTIVRFLLTVFSRLVVLVIAAAALQRVEAVINRR